MLCCVLVNDDNELAVVDDVIIVYVMIVTCYIGLGNTCVDEKMKKSILIVVVVCQKVEEN